MIERYLPPATERELTRMAFRIDLLRQRGESETEAEVWAERLLQRDRDRDDRRLCLECRHLKPACKCEHGPAMRDQLQRCPSFDWMTPQ